RRNRARRDRRSRTVMLVLDGARGEGGGQTLRTALAAAVITGRPFRRERIRAARARPGLQPQHLACVHAAAALCGAEVAGARLDSQTLEFRPGRLVARAHTFAIGTAGSATLLLQCVLPAFLVARDRSTVAVEGGTHNPLAPPFEFFAHALLPLLARMGAKVGARLVRPGFHPRGGGRIGGVVDPAPLRPLALTERGALRGTTVHVVLARLPRHVAEREVKVLRAAGLPEPLDCRIVATEESLGPGNAIAVELRSEKVTEVASAIGARGVPAEVVAERAAGEALAYLRHGAPVGAHLADQLLLPLAVAGGGVFRTSAPTGHTRTNAALL